MVFFSKIFIDDAASCSDDMDPESETENESSQGESFINDDDSDDEGIETYQIQIADTSLSNKYRSKSPPPPCKQYQSRYLPNSTGEKKPKMQKPTRSVQFDTMIEESLQFFDMYPQLFVNSIKKKGRINK
jgi:hypothetical protein